MTDLKKGGSRRLTGLLPALMTLSTLAASPASSEERERLGAGEEPVGRSRLRPAVGEVH